MILGMGSDLCDIRRIERSLERFGERFTQRVFTEGERREATDGRPARHRTPAGSPRGACSKALGTGMRAGVFWRDIEVVNLPSGKPTLRLTGGALDQLRAMTPRAMRPSCTSRSPTTRRRPGSRPDRKPPREVTKRSHIALRVPETGDPSFGRGARRAGASVAPTSPARPRNRVCR